MKVCSIPDCGKRHEARGWCKAHYKRWERHGHPLAGGTEHGAPERFYSEVVVPYEGKECLYWPFAKNGSGYAEMSAGAGRITYVHRLSCEAENGPAPSDSHAARHKCGNGHLGCVARKHMEWGTLAENQRDRVSHGTDIRGEKHPLRKLSSADVATIRSIGRARTQASIASDFGVSRATIGDILSRKRWAAEA
jgi:hypothetical protein